MALFVSKAYTIRLYEDILDLFFPRVCCGCGHRITAEEELICFGCRNKLPKVNFPDHENNELTDRFLGKIHLKFGISYLHFYKSGITQEIMHQFKYNNKPALGLMFGRYLGFEMQRSNLHHGVDMIIPVPIHPKKLRIRGYNQSLKFAQGLSETTDISVAADLLVRTRHGESQTHKTREERQKNVASAFHLVNPELVKDKSVLLVDDVITTGATLEACGLLLLTAGCSELSIATLALAK